MKVTIWYLGDGELVTLELPLVDVQKYIDLVKAHGYENNGDEYKYSYSRVEENTVFIYVEEE